MNQLKISVVIPVYNASKYIQKCVDSILVQSLHDIEIICIDDGSTDGTSEILEKIAKKDSRIKIIKQKNSGASSARNNGIRQAKGEYILFVDSDDFIIGNYAFERMYKKIEKEKPDLLFFSYINNFEIERKAVPVDMLDKFDGIESVVNIFDLGIYAFSFFAMPWFKLHKRDFILRNNIKFNTNIVFYEDFDFFFHIVILNPRVSILNEHLYSYRHGNDNISRKVKKLWRDIFSVFDLDNTEILKFKEKIPEEVYISFLVNRISGIIYWYSQIYGYQRYLYYQEMRSKFLDLEKKYNLMTMNVMKESVRYQYRRILKKNWLSMKISKIFHRR